MNKLTAFARDIECLVTMHQALELYGIDVNRQGFCVCPFHQEKTASFKVYESSFYCFGCGKSGGIVTFVMGMFDIKFADALKKINEDFSLNLPIGERMSIRQARSYKAKLAEIERRRRNEQEHREERTNTYFDLLQEWTRLDRNRRKYRPAPGDTEIHPLYAEVLCKFNHISFLLDNFDWEEPPQ